MIIVPFTISASAPGSVAWTWDCEQWSKDAASPGHHSVLHHVLGDLEGLGYRAEVMHDGTSLVDAVYNDGQQDPDNLNINGSRRGLLNPAWVEALMGLPSGWTDCVRSATQSSQQSPQEPSRNCGAGCSLDALEPGHGA